VKVAEVDPAELMTLPLFDEPREKNPPVLIGWFDRRRARVLTLNHRPSQPILYEDTPGSGTRKRKSRVHGQRLRAADRAGLITFALPEKPNRLVVRGSSGRGHRIDGTVATKSPTIRRKRHRRARTAMAVASRRGHRR
jgi:hypothetical protein